MATIKPVIPYFARKTALCREPPDRGTEPHALHEAPNANRLPPDGATVCARRIGTDRYHSL
jgi:hypothetical protein